MQMALHRLFNHFLMYLQQKNILLLNKKETCHEKKNYSKTKSMICYLFHFCLLNTMKGEKKKLIDEVKRKEKVLSILHCLIRTVTNK